MTTETTALLAQKFNNALGECEEGDYAHVQIACLAESVATVIEKTAGKKESWDFLNDAGLYESLPDEAYPCRDTTDCGAYPCVCSN